MMMQLADYLIPHPTNANVSLSPVALTHELPTVTRLLIMFIFTVIGTFINGFFVSSFFVEHTLRDIGETPDAVGFVFMACIGLADLIVTSGMMPTSTVVLLSGQWDSLPVCRGLQLLGVASTYLYSLYFALIGIESFLRICCTPDTYKVFLKIGVAFMSITVFVVAFGLAGVGVFFQLDYDYCQRLHNGNFYYRVITFVVFHAIPGFVTLFTLITSTVVLKRRNRNRIQYKRSNMQLDVSSPGSNLAVYLLYVTTWIPYLILICMYPDASDHKYYNCVWFGLCRTIITNLLYCITNKSFRTAFSQLFYYVCCKISLNVDARHRQAFAIRRSQVRVHVMHGAVTTILNQRAAASARNTYEL